MTGDLREPWNSNKQEPKVDHLPDQIRANKWGERTQLAKDTMERGTTENLKEAVRSTCLKITEIICHPHCIKHQIIF